MLDFYGCKIDSALTASAADHQEGLDRVLSFLRPKPIPFRLLRIGGSLDGAYLVPDDLRGVTTCLSPGVSNRKDFEDELCLRYGIHCHMCDASSSVEVLRTPLIPGMQTFKPLWLNPAPSPVNVSLADWMQLVGLDGSEDIILQMDIEGGEYLNILAAAPTVLDRFRIIVIELHGLEGIVNPIIYENVFRPFFEKLIPDFSSVHVHPNNYEEAIAVPGTDFNLPAVLELTLLRNDRLPSPGPCRRLHPIYLPHPLDITCSHDHPPLVLSQSWSPRGRRPEVSQFRIMADAMVWQLRRLNRRLGITRMVRKLMGVMNWKRTTPIRTP